MSLGQFPLRWSVLNSHLLSRAFCVVTVWPVQPSLQGKPEIKRWALMSHSIFEGRSYCVDDKASTEKSSNLAQGYKARKHGVDKIGKLALLLRTLCDFLLLLWLVYFLWFVGCSDLQQSKEDKLRRLSVANLQMFQFNQHFLSLNGKC